MRFIKHRFITHRNYKTQSLIALSLIWAVGISILVYLIFFFDKGHFINNDSQTAGLVSEKIQNLNAVDENSPNDAVNDAYVFVNINKKRILTRFVSVMPESETFRPANANPQAISVKKIHKIIKTPQDKKASDFSIKPIPDN